jgi:hypothetical protein
MSANWASHQPRNLLRVLSDWGFGSQAVPLFHVAPVGHSLLFAVGAWPPHDGVRRARRLNLSRDLRGIAALPSGSGLSTRSPRPSSPRERRDSAFVRRKLELLSSCGQRHRCLLAPAELAAISPYTVQDHRQLACARHASALGNVHAAGPQGRPFGATDQQRMGGFVQRGSSQLVAAPADPALHVGLTGLVAPRCQAEVRAHVARSAEAIRPVDCCAERKGGERPNTLNGHQPAARWLDTDLVEHTLGESTDFAGHHVDD